MVRNRRAVRWERGIAGGRLGRLGTLAELVPVVGIVPGAVSVRPVDQVFAFVGNAVEVAVLAGPVVEVAFVGDSVEIAIIAQAAPGYIAEICGNRAQQPHVLRVFIGVALNITEINNAVVVAVAVDDEGAERSRRPPVIIKILGPDADVVRPEIQRPTCGPGYAGTKPIAGLRRHDATGVCGELDAEAKASGDVVRRLPERHGNARQCPALAARVCRRVEGGDRAGRGRVGWKHGAIVGMDIHCGLPQSLRVLLRIPGT